MNNDERDAGQLDRALAQLRPAQASAAQTARVQRVALAYLHESQVGQQRSPSLWSLGGALWRELALQAAVLSTVVVYLRWALGAARAIYALHH